MEKSILNFYNDLKKSRNDCPWSSDQSIEDGLDQVQSEVDEARHDLKNEKYNDLHKEIADIFMDSLFLLILIEEKGVNVKELIDNTNKKFTNRKPWVFSDMKVSSKQEAVDVWNEIKKNEKS